MQPAGSRRGDGPAHLVVSQVTLGPGEVVKLHKASVDAFFYVLEGTPSMDIEGETVTVSPDTLVPNGARRRHAIRDESDVRVRFLAVKTTNRKA